VVAVDLPGSALHPVVTGMPATFPHDLTAVLVTLLTF